MAYFRGDAEKRDLALLNLDLAECEADHESKDYGEDTSKDGGGYRKLV